MTNEQLQAENERLGAEVAALRTLLAAVRAAADVPMPDTDSDIDWQRFLNLSSRRVDLIAIYGNPDAADGQPAQLKTLHNSAEALRAEASRPLHYTPRTADDAWRLTAKGAEVAGAPAAGPGGVAFGPFDADVAAEL